MNIGKAMREKNIRKIAITGDDKTIEISQLTGISICSN